MNNNASNLVIMIMCHITVQKAVLQSHFNSCTPAISRNIAFSFTFLEMKSLTGTWDMGGHSGQLPTQVLAD